MVISALVLAAGHSRRMGTSKLTLAWGETTVIGKIVSTLNEARLNRIYVIIGDNTQHLQNALQGFSVNYINNENHEKGEMLSSVKAGLSKIADESDAALIVLGDQPQIQVEVVRQIINAYRSSNSQIIVPSFQMHRGHPWLIGKFYWNEILNLQPQLTLRDYLNAKHDQISYVECNNASILADIDTHEDYLLDKPNPV